MSLRHIKPQAALVMTTRTQIGSTPMLGISIGVGFRLDDPTILVHETAVWDALKTAAASVPLAETAMPKRCAEWLLAGHSVHRVPSGARGRMVDWAAWVELDGVRKAASCRARVDGSTESNVLARLALDPTQAAAGGARENPLGLASGVAPLQRIGAFGVGPAPLAAMGVLGSDWPERRQWKPSRPGSVEAMARDGSHMGWPEDIDLRFFQQAAPDQWSHRDSWTPGARFELGGFDARGEGCAGALPRLAAVALVTRSGRPGVEQVPLRQQTLWFLPDRDIGVMWWNGSISTDYVLDDSPAMLVAAFKDHDERIDVDALMAFAAQRADLTCTDPTQQGDYALMPDIKKGWTWEMILNTDDHPRFSPPRRSHAEICTRLERHRLDLVDAREGQARMRAFQDSEKKKILPVAISDGRAWRQYFSETRNTELSETTISDADLSDLRFDGWHLDSVRFERCRFDRSAWRTCQLNQVYMADCSFTDATFDEMTWCGGALVRSELQRSTWSSVVLERISIEECLLDNLTVAGGRWSTVAVQGRGGVCGVVRDIAWDGVSWHGVDACQWSWTRVEAHDLCLVKCVLTDLTIAQCKMVQTSAVLSDLSASVWQGSTLTFTVLSHGTSIEGARLSDCVFSTSSFQDLRAHALQVDHCTFIQLHAKHLEAEHSKWTSTLLKGANLTHASLAGASFDRCSLREAMLYGADMRETRMFDCNLIRAHTSWMHPPESGAWRGNLSIGMLEVPRREG